MLQKACPQVIAPLKLWQYASLEGLPDMTDHALPDVESWVQLFTNNSLPVLRVTKRKLDEMRENLDAVDTRELAKIILHDPCMTVRVLAYIQPMHGRSLQHDITTIASAIMMSGIIPFFNRFDNLPTIEQMLHDEDPHALLHVLQIIRRAQRAADYAFEWAAWRHDMNLEEVKIAALLHDLAEILIGCFAPKLSLKIREIQQTRPNMRSTEAQKQILDLTYQDIQLTLCRVWHLPDLLLHLIDDDNAEHHRVRNVNLAVRLARHSANGWQDPALPDDYNDIALLLNLTPETVKLKLGLLPGEGV